ncbi:MAG: type II secretion system F family protein [Candidatus Gastranaerophilales bacterium]|nr:type II secretion system F family protein [Candidatus Gastranaerophilales bacterium]
MNYIVIPLLFAVWAAYITFIFIQKEESFLRIRIKNAGKKYKTNSRKFFDNILETLKPLTAGNIKNIQVKNKIKELLVRVGAPSSEDDILDFENKRLMFVLFVSLACAVALTIFRNLSVLSFSFIALYFAYKFPEMKLKKIIKAREKDFEKHFPDSIDMLSVCVEAGLGLDSAIERVGKEFQAFSPTIGYEYIRLSQDVASGLPRHEALKNLTRRIRCKDLQSFVALLIQSETLGTGIAQPLAVYCDTLRNRKKQRVEELVQTSSAKMTIPMVLFLLPAMFIVILYPSVIKLLDALKTM